jgi:hypothetical protein
MALVLKNGAIFLHIPKTGGNWITDVLEKNNLVTGSLGFKHADIDRLFVPSLNSEKMLLKYFLKRRMESILGRILGTSGNQKPFMFCFVRHPVTWYESWFKYMSQPSRHWWAWGDERANEVWHPNSMLNGLGDPDFNQFVRNVVRKRPGYVTEMYGWYTKSQIDFVGKLENLQEDLVTALKMTGLVFDEESIRNHPKVGVSPEPRQEIIWDRDLKEEVYKLEYAGMVRFGYDRLEQDD